MEFTEYQSIINDLTDPDKQASAIVRLSDGLKADLAQRDTYKQSADTYKTKNDDLREVNSKLALRITNPDTNTKDEDSEEEISIVDKKFEEAFKHGSC